MKIKVLIIALGLVYSLSATDNGNWKTKVIQAWTSGEWIDVEKEVQKHDSFGKLLTKYTSKLKEDKWVYTKLDSLIYLEDRIERFTVNIYSNNFRMNRYVYKKSGVDSVCYDYSLEKDDWIKKMESITKYDEKGRAISFESYKLKKRDKESFMNVYYKYKDGKINEAISETHGINGDKIVFKSKYCHNNDSTISIDSSFRYKNEKWQFSNVRMVKFSYDTLDYDVVEHAMKNEDNNWFAEKKIFIKKDKDNRVVEEKTVEWHAYLKRYVNTYRTIYEY